MHEEQEAEEYLVNENEDHGGEPAEEEVNDDQGQVEAQGEPNNEHVAEAPELHPIPVAHPPRPHRHGFVLEDCNVEIYSDSSSSSSDNGAPPTPLTPKPTPTPEINLVGSSPTPKSQKSPEWQGTKNYRYCVHPSQPCTRLFGTVLERLRIRRNGRQVEICPGAGQSVTIEGKKVAVLLCVKYNRIFYVWVCREDTGEMEMVKDVESVEELSAAAKRTTEDLRIQVLFSVIKLCFYLCAYSCWRMCWLRGCRSPSPNTRRALTNLSRLVCSLFGWGGAVYMGKACSQFFGSLLAP